MTEEQQELYDVASDWWVEKQMIDTLRPWLISLSICLLAGLGWYFILEQGNARIEAYCINSGGKVIQRPGQASYCIKQ